MQTKPGSIIRTLDLYKSTLAIYGHEAATTVLNAPSESDNEVPVGAAAESTEGAWDELPNKELKALTLNEADSGDDNHLQPTLDYVTPWPDFDNRIDTVAVRLARQASNLSFLVSLS